MTSTNFPKVTTERRRLATRAVPMLTVGLLAGGLLISGATASAASSTPSVVENAVTAEHGPGSAEPKWYPGAPSGGSEIADAATLASVPAAAAEAPPAAG